MKVPALLILAGLWASIPEMALAGDVRAVLENRCVVCHACYDAPCQLIFSSPDGAARGANKDGVYEAARLKAAPPTRLGIDAHGEEQWRAKGFFPVFGGDASLFLRMLALGSASPFPAGSKLPADVDLDIGRTLSCATTEEFDAYAQKHPHGGMPYGMARLAEKELRTLTSWAAQGAPPAMPATAVPAQAAHHVKSWEQFLNGTALKERVVARYLYEHWFVAHLYFDDHPAGPFFRIVRSRTPSGRPIDEIATRRPYDDPGAPVFYRLQPIEGTIVHKTHIPYALSAARLERLRSQFLAPDWKPTQFPSHAPAVASNPFVAFAEIPPRARYQFLLDDAHFFVDTFIRGPVCRGQVAVDVIEDHFWAAFLDPDHDLSVTQPDFLAETQQLLALPSEDAGWIEYNRSQRKYLNAQERFYDRIDPERRGPALDWIWDGDGKNPSALLTIFRNFDNATVVTGFAGAVPKTAWVLDYPIFERIYYDLVAGYDVFGAAPHQLATRLYMDHLRMQAENTFLGFLPADRRDPIRASWYVGATHQVEYFLADRLRNTDHGTQVRFSGDDPKREMLEQILTRNAAVAGPPDLLNRCAEPPCDRAGASPRARAIERSLQRLASVRGPWVAKLPEVSVLFVREGADGNSNQVYTFVRNVAHTNVAMLFGEDKRLIPADDTLTVMRGHFGSYPNFFFDVEAGGIDAFSNEVLAVSNDAEFQHFLRRHGVRRTDARFWPISDWLRHDARRANATTAGVYDLGRYVDP